MPSGYVYSWTGKLSGAFGTAGNWNNNTAGATATTVPGLNDEALVVASGAIAGPGAAFELGLTGTATGLTASNSLYGAYVYVGGTVTLASGAGLGSGNLIDIGDNASSSIAGKIPTLLTVGPNSFISATLATANTFDILVGSNGGNGTLAVTGARAIASSGTEGFWVGDAGTGVIAVSGGGFIEGGTPYGGGVRQIDLALGSSGGAGTLNISGTSSGATFSNTAEVGFGGTGVLSVSAGGIFLAGDGVDAVNIGDTYNGAVGAGSVNLNAGSAYLAGLTEVGAYGQGNLSLTSGAFLLDYDSVPAGGTAPAWSVLIGANAGSRGTLSLAGQSTMATWEGVAVGSAGAGELDVTNSTLSIYAPTATGTVALDVGLSAGSTGVVNIAGGLINDAYSAGVVIGGGGSGTVAITQVGSQGGGLLAGNPVLGIGLTVGATAGSSGVLTVDGADSGVGVYGAVDDGVGGQGAIALSDGAHLVAAYQIGGVGLVVGGSGGRGALTMASGAWTNVTGQTVVGNDGPGTLTMGGGSGLTIHASGNAALVAGASAGSTGSVLISDPYTYAVLSGGADIGNAGTGSLTVQNFARVTSLNTGSLADPALLIAAAAGSTGTVSLASQAEFTTLGAGVSVGSEGNGVLNVANATLTITMAAAVGASALSLGAAAGATGIVNVDGGVIFDTQSAGLLVGVAGSGTLAIAQSGSQGGQVLTGDPTASAGVAVGIGAGSVGAISIDGTASFLGDYGTLQDGVSGHGSIGLTHGARLTADLAPNASGMVLGGVGGSGIFSIGTGAQVYIVGQSVIGGAGIGLLSITGGSSFTGTATTVPAMVIGSSSTGTGSVVISDGATYVPVTGGLIVGNSGVGSLSVANTALLVLSGSTAAATPGAILGNNAGSQGTLSVSSQATVRSSTAMAVGSFGRGVLNVSSATVSLSVQPGGLPALDVGANVGSTGVVDVSGGTIADTLSAGMIVGDIGTGTLDITQLGSQGGSVTTGNPAGLGLQVGNAASAVGSVAVSGAASTLAVHGTVMVGVNGVGAVSLTAQAHLSASNAASGTGLELGVDAAGIGSMSVAGGAQASVGGQVVVGALGSGFLSVTGGSHFSAQAAAEPALVVGSAAGSTGNVVVSDASSLASLLGGVQVGGAGYGTLTVENTARVSTDAALTVGVHGTVVVTGAGSTLAAGALADAGSVSVSGGQMAFLGAVTGAGSLAVGGNGLLSLGSTDTTNLTFASGGGTVSAVSAADLGGAVNGWSAGDFIDLTGTTATSENFANGTLSLFGAGNHLLGTIAFSGALASHNFTLSALAGGGTAIAYHT